MTGDGVTSGDGAQTDLADLKEQLLQQRWQIDLAVSAAKLGLFHWDVETDALWVSPGLPALYGLAEEDATCGQALLDVIDADDLAAVDAAIEVSRQTGDDFEAEFRVRLPEGATRWLAGRGRWAANHEGPPRVVLGANWDISATKFEALRSRHILDGLGAFAALVSCKGIVLEANLTALDLAGVAAEDVVGKPFWQTAWWSHEPILQAQLQRAIERASGGEAVVYDVCVPTAQGEWIDLEFRLAPLHDTDGSVVQLVASGFEIGGRKRAEEATRLVNRELKHRMANVFAVIGSLLRLSSAHSHDVPAFVDATTQRLRALEAAHRDAERPSKSPDLELGEVARHVLAPWLSLEPSRLTLDGAPVSLSRGQATAFGLILHELGTNAVKYGSLSGATGSVRVCWQRTTGGGLELRWHEQGGPAVVPPTHKGFGLSVIETLATTYLDGTADLDFAPTGLMVEVSGHG